MSFIKRNTKIILPLALLLTASVAGTAIAEDKPEADLTVGLYSQYIWRGYELSKDSIVIQPSMTVSYKGFGFNLWGNLDTEEYATNDNNFTETDMTLSYMGQWTNLAMV